ncbi:hypothetical protein [Winogradskyella marincola]|uniref:Uncharacterized protein n=1 Tax=Winogradskyella marincola TaxID=3037795 RepID=A0ABT6G2B3_9FLAO|nr:hypothetical protein [Winogradskyella sp. YYF002]MDG4716185.1 hypothetical protein [Winogradskyella sp. YYF002]
MTDPKPNNKWKKGFLKTGLPLEYVTSNILNKLGHLIFGEYPYIRPDERRELKEFSVDLRTYKTLDNSNDERLIVLSMLIECKYRQQGTSWIFSPFPSEMIPLGIMNSTEDIVPVRIENENVLKFEKGIGYCISGVELSADGNGNTNGVKHGIFQLRFAMPEFVKNDYVSGLERTYYDGRFIDLSCAILVTTADIRVIKPNKSLEDFTSANELDDVTEIKEAIIVNERPGPQLQEFADKLGNELIKEHPELEKRLLDIDKVLIGKEWENRYAPDLDTIKRSIGYSAERILIINHKYLDKTIKNLETALQKDIKMEKVYGKVLETNNGFEIKPID